MTTKWWNPDHYGAVVAAMPELNFVHVGGTGQWNPEIPGAIRLAGTTDHRTVMKLAYFADGILSSISFGMHLAAALETRPDGPRRRPCVVIGGGKEEPSFYRYPKHRVLDTIGMLPCCADGPCWRDQVVRDCLMPLSIKGVPIATCMDMISPETVVNAIRSFYFNGKLADARSLQVPREKVA